jgi:hypothetical protein
VQFSFEQHIAAPPERVLAALADPSYYEALRTLPGADVVSVEPPAHRGDRVLIRVGYHFRGELPGGARRLLDPGKLTWIVETDLDLARSEASFAVLPVHYPDLLSCSGTYRLTGVEGGTLQDVAGDLRVRMPLVGRPVERALVSGLQDRLRAESAALARWKPRSEPADERGERRT